MASAVDICNLALARIGDDASIASIDPPEADPQAQYSSMFYPIARDSLLELHDWSFATTRVTLAQLSNSWPEYDYAYALPSDMLRALAVLPPDATDDYSVSLASMNNYPGLTLPFSGVYAPQRYVIEANSQGVPIMLTDQPNAVLRYTRAVTDTSNFPPLFVDALGWLLASYLAGPLVKGTSGVQVAQAMLKACYEVLGRTKNSDANQQHTAVTHNVAWIAGR